MKKNKITLTKSGIKKAIKNELKKWDCIQDNADLLGITEQIMKIVKPLIPTNDSNSAQKKDMIDLIDSFPDKYKQ